MEINLQNRKYTRSNGRRNPTLVRLDRAFCSRDWDEMFPDISMQAMSSSLSDHCPLFLCNMHQPHRRATFKFESFWARVPGFMETVESAWATPVNGISPLMVLHNKLTNTSVALRTWSKSLFSEARIQLQVANEVIFRLDKAQESRRLSDLELDLLKQLKLQVLGWAAVERSRRRQSSRIVQIREGDACTKFFHQRAKGRRKRNLIACLKDNSGTLVWNHTDKQSIIDLYR